MITDQKHYKKFILKPEQSLQLTHPVKIIFPQPQDQQPSKVYQSYLSFSDLMGRGSKPKNKQIYKQIVYISERIFFMMKGKIITVYQYEGNYQVKQEQQKVMSVYEKQSEKQSDYSAISCKPIYSFYLQFKAKEIKIYESCKTSKDKTFYFIALDTALRCLELLSFDCLANKQKSIKVMKTKKQINCLSFIDPHQIMFWCDDMLIYHYEVGERGFHQLAAIDSQIDPIQECKVEMQIDSLRDNKTKVEQIKQKAGNHKHKYTTITQKLVLNYSTILGNKSYGEQSVLVLFYVLFEQNYNIMKIKCKQILYPLQNPSPQKSILSTIFSYNGAQQNKIRLLKRQTKDSQQKDQTSYQIVSQNKTFFYKLNCLDISKVQNSYLAKFDHEIVLIQKKFGNYYATDNIYKHNKECQVIISANSNTIACLYEDLLEINQIGIGDSKAHSKMVDFIDLRIKKDQRISKNESAEEYRRRIQAQKMHPKKHQKKNPVNHQKQQQEIQKKLMYFWVGQNVKALGNNTKKSLFFIFSLRIPDPQGVYNQYICLYQGKIVQKLKKLTKLGRQSLQNEELQQIQKLGENLGVDETKFYYSMWKQSKKQYEDIKDYLIKCNDYKIIMGELKSFLRKRDLKVASLFQFLRHMQLITKQKIRQKLSEDRLQDYFEICFIVRKFKIYSNEYEVNEKYFIKCMQSSLHDIIQTQISRVLFKVEKEPSPWQQSPKQPPSFNMIQIFDEFKLPLLENYYEFLNDILLKFQNHILQMLKSFPVFLPVYPYNSLIEYVTLNESLNLSHINLNAKQEGLFTEIFKDDIKHEESFMQNIVRDLEKYFPTTEVKKTIINTLKRQMFKNQRLYTHTITTTDIAQYLKNIENVQAEKFYLLVLQRIILAAHHNKEKARIQELIDLLKQKYKITGLLQYRIFLIGSIFELFLHHHMIPESTEIQEMFYDPIQKWISLLFLGNHSKEGLLFNEFHQLFFKMPEDFIQSLKRYVFSGDSSKIELIRIVRLAANKCKEMKKNQQILNSPINLDINEISELLIDSFCSKICLNYSKDDILKFQKNIRTIELGTESLLKLQKIENLMSWRSIFENFKMQNKTIISFFNNTPEILNEMFQIFFEQNLRTSKIEINSYEKGNQSREIKKKYLNLDECEDMIYLAIKARDLIFWEIENNELVLLICRKLIQWQRFDEIMRFLYDSPEIAHFQNLNIHALSFQLVQSSLNQLYCNQQLYFDDETIEYIKKILDIGKYGSNPRVIQEEAKIQLVSEFKKWGNYSVLNKQPLANNDNQQQILTIDPKHEEANQSLQQGFTIKLVNLDRMCSLWTECEEDDSENPQNVKYFIIEMFENYGSYITLRSFSKIYKCFRMISEGIKPYSEQDSFIYEKTQFYIYCEKLAQNQVLNHRFEWACETLSFLISKDYIIYALSIECMLGSLINQCKKTASDQQILTNQLPTNSLINNISQLENHYNIPKSQDLVLQPSVSKIKRYIDYFIYYWNQKNIKKISAIFVDTFQDELYGQQEEYFYVHPQICYNDARVKIPTDSIWDFVVLALAVNPTNSSVDFTLKKRDIQASVDLEKVIYCYFFLAMGLVEPKTGFCILKDIGYDHPSIQKCFIGFQYHCDVIKVMYSLDISIIYEQYLASLTNLIFVNMLASQAEEQQGVGINNNSMISNQSGLGFQKTGSMIIGRVQSGSIMQTQELKIIGDFSENLKLLRDQFRSQEFRNHPLRKTVLSLIDLFSKAKKKDYSQMRITKYRAYNGKQQKHNFSLNKLSEQNNSITKSPTKINATLNQIDNAKLPMKFSFNQFKELKQYVQESLVMNSKKSLSSDEAEEKPLVVKRPTERLVLQSMIKYIKNGDIEENSHEQEEEIGNILKASIVDVIDKDSPLRKKLFREQDSPNAIKVNKVDIFEQIGLKPISHQDYQGDKVSDDRFIKLIQEKCFQEVWKHLPQSKWVQKIEQVYNREELGFHQILSIFYEHMNDKSADSGLSQQLTYYFNEDKVKVLFLADPTKFLNQDDNKSIKLFFDFEYLCEDFETNYQVHRTKLTQKLLSLEPYFSIKNYHNIINYIAEIQKIRYLKLVKVSITYRIAVGQLYLGQLIQNGEYCSENVSKLNEVIGFFEPQGYKQVLRPKQSKLYQEFIEHGKQELAEWFITSMTNWRRSWRIN